MHVFNIPLLPQDVSWLDIITVLLPLGLAWFAYARFWPDFKKQKRIENLHSNVKEALKLLFEAEQAIIKLYSLVNGPKDSGYKETNDEILICLERFKDSLLFVVKDQNLEKNVSIVVAVKFISELGKVLSHKYEQASFAAIDFLSDLKLLDKEKPTRTPLDGIRQELLKIYEMSD